MAAVPWLAALSLAASTVAAPPAPPDDESSLELDEALRGLDTSVLAGEAARRAPAMLEAHAREQIAAANRRESSRWREVRTLEDWERYRDARIAALQASLGSSPPLQSAAPRMLVTKTIEGDGHRIEGVVFESRPGVLVTANLYLPAPAPAARMPGIVIVHSHHAPKEEAELQDMGVAWARTGCTVLVMDQLGHGERRQHPFVDAKSYAGSFRAGRQDYYFRANAGAQLHVAGESLIGWMAGDIRRGVDLLLARPGIDANRIVLLGAVAGGGDPAAVAAAVDRRIAAVVPFNFGGPQPETRYPLPPGAEETFNYAGGGSWEPTRNLRLSARDGFLPWVIVGAVAPRGLVYAHEFSWDRDRDPVWSRLERIYSLHDARDRLAFAHGRGLLSGQPPEATHCTNIGPEHRQFIDDAFRRWFGIAPPPSRQAQRRPREELRAMTEAARAELGSRPLHEVLLELGRSRAAAARRALEALPADARRAELRRRWAELLGGVDATADPRVIERRSEALAGGVLERIALETEAGIVVPLLILLPPEKAGERVPVVLAFAQEGKQRLLQGRRGAAVSLLEAGVALCVPDVRGTGETRPEDDDRGRSGESTAIASTYLILGRTLLGSRLADLRSVLGFLGRHSRLDGSRVAVWGDSLAPQNPPGTNLQVPLGAEPSPRLAEPLGDALAFLAALFEERVAAVFARGGLRSFESLLESPFLYVPHDSIVPSALLAGDLPLVIETLPTESVRREGVGDGLNREVAGSEPVDEAEIARWLVSRLRG